MDDAAKTLQALARDLPPWTPEQCRQMADTVTKVTSDMTNHTSTSLQGRAQCQKHMYMHAYLTGNDWAIITKSSVPMSHRMSTVIARAFSIGLLHPSEVSVVSIVSLLVVAGEHEFTSDEFYNLARDFKSLLKVKRSHSTSLAPTLREFPLQVQDFTTVHPDRYTDADPPVVSRVPASAIESLRLSMPARNTHKSLASKGNVKPCSPQISAASNMQSFMAMMAEAFMNNPALPAAPHPKKKFALALANDEGELGDQSQAFSRCHSVADSLGMHSPMPATLPNDDQVNCYPNDVAAIEDSKECVGAVSTDDMANIVQSAVSEKKRSGPRPRWWPRRRSDSSSLMRASTMTRSRC